MSLPPGLPAGLAKRVILKAQHESEAGNETPTVQTNEEIIAEDYDSKPEEPAKNEHSWKGYEAVNVDPIKGHRGCPNKSSLYHEFCEKKRKSGEVPDEVYLELKKKALEIWPLPPGWKEAYDEGFRLHYYWNIHNNLICWLPPTHPAAFLTLSAAYLREKRIKFRRILKEGHESDEDSETSDQEVPQQPQKREKGNECKERDLIHHRSKRPRVYDNDFYPLGLASFSDKPGGN